jgi:hypothetical protein
MKKILSTTALVSTLVLSANYALAQTTVTGQLDLGYKAYSGSPASDSSYRSFTRESQINIANKGKLSNGIDYVAGFSWEVDGNEAVATGSFAENTYIDFIMGKTTLSISADHIQNANFEITNLAGGVADIDDLVIGHNSSATVKSLAAIHGTNNANRSHEGHGIGIIHDFGVAKASINYVPDRTGGNAAANDGSTSAVDNGNSQIDVMIRGNFGVKGLDAFIYRGESDSETPGTSGSAGDLEGLKYGVSYNFGQFSVAASQSKVESINDVEAKTTSFGVAFAPTKEVTIGLIQAKTSADGIVTTAKAATPDEKLRAINVGYNLGPVVANLMYVDSDNLGGSTASDPKTLHLNLTTKF